MSSSASASSLTPLSRSAVLAGIRETGILLEPLLPIVVDYLRFDYAWSLQYITQLNDFLYLSPALFVDWRSVHASHARCLCSPYRSLVTRENEALLGASAVSQAKYCLDQAGDVFVMNPLFLHQYQHPHVIERLYGDITSVTSSSSTPSTSTSDADSDSRPSTPTLPPGPVGPRPDVIVKLNADPDLSLALSDVECSCYGTTAFRFRVHSYLECIWLGVITISRAKELSQLQASNSMAHRIEMSRMRENMSTESGVCFYASDKLDPSQSHAELLTCTETACTDKPVTAIQNGDIIDIVVAMPEYDMIHSPSAPPSPTSSSPSSQVPPSLTQSSPSTGTITFYRNHMIQGTCWISSHDTWIPCCLLDCQGDTLQLEFLR